MTHEDLELALKRLIGKAMKAGERQYAWPYQRIGVYNDLVGEALDLIDGWDTGREWHVQIVSTAGRWDHG